MTGMNKKYNHPTPLVKKKYFCNEAESTNETSKSRHEVLTVRMFILQRSNEWHWDSKWNSVATGRESPVIIRINVPLVAVPKEMEGPSIEITYDHLSSP